MKFLPENKRKQIISLILLVGSIGGIVYINFFAGGSAGPAPVLPPEEDPDIIAAADEGGAGFSDESEFDEFIPAAGTGLIPYGTGFNLQILENEDYKKLQNPPEFSVSKDELGKDNLFVQ